MASALKVLRTMDLDHGVRGLGGMALDGAVSLGSGYALGQVYHRYSDKWFGKQAPKLMAAVGLVGAAVTQVVTGGRAHLVSGMMASFGQTGLSAIGIEYGLAHAKKATGKKVVMLPAGAAIPAGASEVAIGALGSAKPGRALTFEEIENMAAMR